MLSEQDSSYRMQAEHDKLINRFVSAYYFWQTDIVHAWWLAITETHASALQCPAHSMQVCLVGCSQEHVHTKFCLVQLAVGKQ